MPRAYNPFANSPYPTDPGFAEIGSSLASALFGDPELAQQLQLRKAQMAQLQSEADYNRARTEGQGYTNQGLSSLAEAMANPQRFVRQSAQPTAVPNAPTFPSASISGAPVMPSAAPAAAPSNLVAVMLPITVRSESAGNPNAVSPKGARGLMQVMPATARDPGFGIQPSNGTPQDDVRVGQQYLAKLTERYGGDPAKAWAAYHSGPGFVDRAVAQFGPNWQSALGPQGKAYVSKNTAALGGTVPVTGGGVTTQSPSATVTPPTLAPEPGGDVVDRDAVTQLAIAAALGNREAAITPLTRAILALAGGDQNARAALIAGGNEPGKDFAASREAQLNNMALDQYGNLGKTLAQESLQQAGSTQRENISQAGETARNNADNATSIQIASMKPQPGSGPNGGKLPVGAQKIQDDHLNAIGVSAGVNDQLNTAIAQINSGKLRLGPVENAISAGANYMGASTENSRNFNSFKATIEKIRNQTLLLNRGVQTEGDAQRALNELFGNLNDAQVVKQRLREIQQINQRAIALRQQQVAQIRADNGLSDIDYSRFTNPQQRPPLSSFKR